MRKSNALWRRIELALLALGLTGAAWAQNTLGTLVNTASSFDGYTLLAPVGSTETYLLDNCGRVVQSWSSDFRPGLAAYLLPNGDLIRSVQLQSSVFAGGGIGGGFEQWDWEGNLVRFWNAATDSLHAHHDFTVLPNGNLLLIAWERHSGEEAIARGRDPELTSPEVWVTRVEERDAEDEVVWAWSVWDHLVQDFDAALPGFGEPSAHPGRIDVNFNATALAGGAGPGGGELAAADWLHVNAIDYHADLDQIALSSRKFDEIWIIDHGLTTEEAAGPAGDLLYRWGNPQSYGRGTEADRRFYGQHDVHWVGDNLLVFNNGAGRPEGAFSTVEEWTPPLLPDGHYELDSSAPFGPESLAWIYPETGTTDFYSGNISGAQRLPGGTTLICEGARGRLLEVESDGTAVWEYVNPMTGVGPLVQGTDAFNNQVFLARRYAPDFPGFAGRDLTPGDPIELQPDLSGCSTFTAVPHPSPTALVLHPNPGTDALLLPAPNGPDGRFVVYDVWGRVVAEGRWSDAKRLEASKWPSGQYVVHTFGASPVDCTRTKWMKS
jgi:hypothetical protein